MSRVPNLRVASRGPSWSGNGFFRLRYSVTSEPEFRPRVQDGAAAPTNHLHTDPYSKLMKPVALPPGRARLCKSDRQWIEQIDHVRLFLVDDFHFLLQPTMGWRRRPAGCSLAWTNWAAPFDRVFPIFS